MIVEIFPSAETDIIRQFRYYLVNQEAPALAIRFREAVMESIERLKEQPHLGSVYGGSMPKLRSWQVAGFEAMRIYYREATDRIQIVRILHSKRNVRRILDREKPVFL